MRLLEFELRFQKFLYTVIGQLSLKRLLISAVLSVRHKSPCRQLLNVKLIFFRLSIGFLPCYIFFTEKIATDFKIFSVPVSLKTVTVQNIFKSFYRFCSL
jgi:hypothetical protein